LPSRQLACRAYKVDNFGLDLAVGVYLNPIERNEREPIVLQEVLLKTARLIGSQIPGELNGPVQVAVQLRVDPTFNVDRKVLLHVEKAWHVSFQLIDLAIRGQEAQLGFDLLNDRVGLETQVNKRVVFGQRAQNQDLPERSPELVHKLVLVCQNNGDVLTCQVVSVLHKHLLDEALELVVVAATHQDIRVEGERLGEWMKVGDLVGQVELVAELVADNHARQRFEDASVQLQNLINWLFVNADQDTESVDFGSIVIQILLLPNDRRGNVLADHQACIPSI